MHEIDLIDDGNFKDNHLCKEIENAINISNQYARNVRCRVLSPIQEEDENAINSSNGPLSRQVKLCGELERKCTMCCVPTWRNYWFVLVDRFLLYYRSREDYNHWHSYIGCISLEPPCNVDAVSSSSSLFHIRAKYRVIKLRAKNHEEQERWVLQILSSVLKAMNYLALRANRTRSLERIRSEVEIQSKSSIFWQFNYEDDLCDDESLQIQASTCTIRPINDSQRGKWYSKIKKTVQYLRRKIRRMLNKIRRKNLPALDMEENANIPTETFATSVRNAADEFRASEDIAEKLIEEVITEMEKRVNTDGEYCENITEEEADVK